MESAMKTEKLKTGMEVLGKLMVMIWHKAPLVLLIFVYVTLVFAQKQLSDQYPMAPERYFDNNHLQVSKLGQGSICVHGNQTVVESEEDRLSINIK
jgi:hypothetical protein